MRKVVLIIPPNDFASNVNTVRFTLPLAPSLGALSVASYLAAHDVPVEMIDVQMDFGFGLTHTAEQVVARRVAEYLERQAEAIAWVGISQLSNTGSGLVLAEAIQAALPQTPIVWGGYFPATAYSLLLDRPGVTAIVRGDGEDAALAISRCLDRGQSLWSSDVPGLVWREDGQVHANPVRQVALRGLPTLDLYLLSSRTRYRHLGLVTSRGCPYRCHYCLERTMRTRYTVYPVEWVEHQLAHLVAAAPRVGRLFIYDPIFGVRPDRTRVIGRLLAQHGFQYGAECRADNTWLADAIPALRETGLGPELIFWGVESASAATLLRMGKVRSAAHAQRYVARAQAVLEQCFRHDVTSIISLMLGYPGDGEGDWQATLQFVSAVRHAYGGQIPTPASGPGFMVFPGTTKVYLGSPLADTLTAGGTALAWDGPFVGEQTLVDGADAARIAPYQAAIAAKGALSPVALERLSHYGAFDLRQFLDDHPALVDADGVVHLGDSLHRLTADYVVGRALLRFDKSKE